MTTAATIFQAIQLAFNFILPTCQTAESKLDKHKNKIKFSTGFLTLNKQGNTILIKNKQTDENATSILFPLCELIPKDIDVPNINICKFGKQVCGNKLSISNNKITGEKYKIVVWVGYESVDKGNPHYYSEIDELFIFTDPLGIHDKLYIYSLVTLCNERRHMVDDDKLKLENYKVATINFNTDSHPKLSFKIDNKENFKINFVGDIRNMFMLKLNEDLTFNVTFGNFYAVYS
ncbi:hypothetical protein CDIK_2355 [Cucumispora dikerogammari]|nr:hypothetical protein CDIK_2355 [Cucumispora dikerogammari]